VIELAEEPQKFILLLTNHRNLYLPIIWISIYLSSQGAPYRNMMALLILHSDSCGLSIGYLISKHLLLWIKYNQWSHIGRICRVEDLIEEIEVANTLVIVEGMLELILS
jgi:hypothetical protein